MANGWAQSNMATECRFGQMELVMKASGLAIRRVGKENSGTLMEISSKVNGKTIKLMAMAFTFTAMVQDMKATGKTICSTAWEKKSGQTILCTRGFTKMEKSTAKAFTSGQMDPLMMELGFRIGLKVKALTPGMMAESTLVNGRIITCTA